MTSLALLVLFGLLFGQIAFCAELSQPEKIDKYPGQGGYALPAPPEKRESIEPPEHKKEKIDFFKETGIHGFLETRNYFNIRNQPDQYYDFRNDLRSEKILKINENIKLKGSLDARYYLVDGKDRGPHVERAEFKLWEGYADVRMGKLDSRIGQQLIRWGKSDELNPTDVFTPEDFTELVNKNLRAERKIPVLALKSDYYHNSSCAVEFIWVPLFVKNKIGENGSAWEPYVKKVYNDLYVPTFFGPFKIPLEESTLPQQLKYSAYAVKWMHTLEKMDYSLSYSYHADENPSYRIHLNEARVIEKHPMQHTIGGDFETVIGKIGLRGEAAYTTDRSYVNIDPLDGSKIFLKDGFLSVLGGDYTFGQDLYFNIQYASEIIFHYQDFMIEQNYSDSVLWKINKKFMRDKLVIETIGRYYLSRIDYFYRASLTYDLNDNLKFMTGVDFYGGEYDGTFGQFKKNDQVFARLKQSF